MAQRPGKEYKSRLEDEQRSATYIQGEQPEVGNSLLMVTPPGSPLPVTHLPNEAKTLPDTNVTPHARNALTETTSLVYIMVLSAALRHKGGHHLL